MGLRCTVCDHPQRVAIDKLVTLDVSSERSIAKQFNVGHVALHRHKAHISRQLAQTHVRQRNAEGDEFLDGIRKTLNRMSFGVQHGLQAAKDGLIEPETAFRMVPSMAAQQLRALELLGQATGRLNGAPANQINVAVVIPQQSAQTPVIDSVTRPTALPIIDADD